MQNEPEKIVGNYNEWRSTHPAITLPRELVEFSVESQQKQSWQEIVKQGVRLVESKVNELLGPDNKLTNGGLTPPNITVVETDPTLPNWAGYFSSSINKITLIEDKINDDPLSKMKVFIHEYLHYLCHNGRDDSERIDRSSPLARNNNVGFRRNLGIDIRQGAEGEFTTDYFLAFNEAVTEQLAIDVLPGVHETYSDYRGLLNQAIDDAVDARVGSNGQDGTYTTWSREQVKNYIYGCFFRGDIDGFTKLLMVTYHKYDVSEQQFGLMTHRDDLPRIIERRLKDSNPGSPPPPAQVALLVQQRLNHKTSDDYVTDVDDPRPDDGGLRENLYTIEYDTFVKTNNIIPLATEKIGGVDYDIDSTGLIVYRSDAATSKLQYIREIFDGLLPRLKSGEMTVESVNNQVDELLFVKYRMSMLSDGFRDFYIYKHIKLDNIQLH